MTNDEKKKYTPYKPVLASENKDVQNYNQQMANMNEPSTDYVKQYTQNAIEKMNQPFTYNYANDPSYKALYEVAVANGQKAMKDTMGKASAMTGGYANSYMQMAGQGAYNDYMTRLNEQIPTLENAAYQRYRDSISDSIQQADLAKMLYGLDTDAYDRQYARLGDQRDFAYKSATADAQLQNDAQLYNLGFENKPYENQMSLDHQTELAKMQSDVGFAEWKKQQDYTNKQKQNTATDNIDSTISYYNNLADRGIITKEQASEYIKSELLGGGGNNPNLDVTDQDLAKLENSVNKSIKAGDIGAAGIDIGDFILNGKLTFDKGSDMYATSLIEGIAKGVDKGEALDALEDFIGRYGDGNSGDNAFKKLSASVKELVRDGKIYSWNGNEWKEEVTVREDNTRQNELYNKYYKHLKEVGEYTAPYAQFIDDIKNGRIYVSKKDGRLVR